MLRRVPIGAVLILVLAGLATILAPGPGRDARIAGTVRLCGPSRGHLPTCQAPDGWVTVVRGASDVGVTARIAQGRFSLAVHPGLRVLDVRVPRGSYDTLVRAPAERTTLVHFTFAGAG